MRKALLMVGSILEDPKKNREDRWTVSTQFPRVSRKSVLRP